MKQQLEHDITEGEGDYEVVATDDVLNRMMRAMRAASPLYTPSVYWEHLVARHMQELERGGFANFKRTVNMRYFNWGIIGILRHQLIPVLRHWLARPSLTPFYAKFSNYRTSHASKAKSFDPATAVLYKTYVAMLADFVASTDKLRLFDKITEPQVGNPFLVNYRGHLVSQDLCNSIHEFYSSTSTCDPWKSGFRIAELGAGYGRLGYVYLSVLPNASYCVIDIPPALYVAQRYLIEVFPDQPIFKFREFSSYDVVRKEFESSRIRLLAAHQIELLPPDQFDLFVNISSLHEMSREQIVNYFRQIDRLCRGSFYSKQWRSSRMKGNGFTIREFDYPIPDHWSEVFHRRHPIQRMFFEALYTT